jgi:hypothetical protein
MREKGMYGEKGHLWGKDIYGGERASMREKGIYEARGHL